MPNKRNILTVYIVKKFCTCQDIFLLLNYGSKSFADHWTNDHCNDHFHQICRNEWNDTDCKCSRYGVSGLEAEPYGSKCITYNGSNNHSKKLQTSVRELVNNDTCDNCHWDKANNVSASRTGKFSKTSGKS